MAALAVAASFLMVIRTGASVSAIAFATVRFTPSATSVKVLLRERISMPLIVAKVSTASRERLMPATPTAASVPS
ncbi:hypothetical protein D3C80_2111670 [compost metagenome]